MLSLGGDIKISDLWFGLIITHHVVDLRHDAEAGTGTSRFGIETSTLYRQLRAQLYSTIKLPE